MPPARDCCLVNRRPAGSRPLVTGPCTCCPPFLPCGSAWVGWLRPLLATLIRLTWALLADRVGRA